MLLCGSGPGRLRAGFAALGAGLMLALAAAGCALVAFARIWTEGRRGFGLAVKGLLLACLILAYPAWFAFKALTLPALTDISTDIEDPPPVLPLARCP